jgi:hypothetical protein
MVSMKTPSEQIASRCKHFTRLHFNKCCALGVDYDTVRDQSASPYRWACFGDGTHIPCALREFPTAEEVAAEEAEIEQCMTRSLTAMKAVAVDAKAKGFKRGNGGAGSVKCPVCESGTLAYSVASYNGHIWGKCSTEDCVSWMQ